jgi:hypothetical protein
MSRDKQNEDGDNSVSQFFLTALIPLFSISLAAAGVNAIELKKGGTTAKIKKDLCAGGVKVLTRKETYMAPPTLRPYALSRARVVVFAILTGTKKWCRAGTILDERYIYMDGHCATFKWWLCPLYSLSLLNSKK